jgi:hypothetical protein
MIAASDAPSIIILLEKGFALSVIYPGLGVFEKGGYVETFADVTEVADEAGEELV